MAAADARLAVRGDHHPGAEPGTESTETTATEAADEPTYERPSPGENTCEELRERNISGDPDVIIDPLVIGPLQEFLGPLGGTITQATDNLDCAANLLPVYDGYGIYFASDDTHISFGAATSSPEQWAADLESLGDPGSTMTLTTFNGYPALESGKRFSFVLFDESQGLRVQVMTWVGDFDDAVRPSPERQQWIIEELLPRILDRSLAP